MKTPTDFKITYYGIDHEQYFQGHGIALTKWNDCATGIGSCNAEALNDALDSLAQNDWDIEALERMIQTHSTMPNDKPDSLDEGMYYYVAVDVKGAL